MVQPISSLTSTPSVSPAAGTSAPPSQPSVAAATKTRTSAPASYAPLLSVGVERADNGVFVYTLRNTESGRLLVVIPRGALQTGSKVQTQA